MIFGPADNQDFGPHSRTNSNKWDSSQGKHKMFKGLSQQDMGSLRIRADSNNDETMSMDT